MSGWARGHVLLQTVVGEARQASHKGTRLASDPNMLRPTITEIVIGFVSAVGMCKTDNVTDSKVAKCRLGGDGNGSVIEGYYVILITQQTNPIEVSEVQFLSQNKTYR